MEKTRFEVTEGEIRSATLNNQTPPAVTPSGNQTPPAVTPTGNQTPPAVTSTGNQTPPAVTPNQTPP